MANKNLIIIGTSNNSKLAKFYFDKDTDYNVVAFSVEQNFLTEDTFENLPVVSLENLEETFPPASHDAFVAVGYTKMNKIREQLYGIVKSKGYKLANYISPNCSFLTEETIGDNNFILEDNTIQPLVKIGSNNVLWSGNHIGHDVHIGDNNFITSHVVVSGFTIIESNSFIGVNASINDNLTVGSHTLIGSGAVISKSTEKESVWVASRSTCLGKKSSHLKI